MVKYLLRRVGQSIIVLFGVSIIIFGITRALPGGPARAILGVQATPQAVTAFNRANGYDKPVFVQYGSYVNMLIHGNLGFSYINNQPVSQLIAQDVPKSVYMAMVALLVSLLIALPLGIRQAVHRNGALDYTATAGAFIGYSMPVFWLGLLLISEFALRFPIFPTEAPQAATVIGAIEQPMAMVLPVATLAILSVAAFSRFMRSSAIENLAQDYITTARAKGLTERAVLYRHLLRNALMPIVTLVALNIPFLITSQLVVEQVFNYPGYGLLFYESALKRDYPVELALTLVAAVLVVVCNLIADVVYGIIDPRVRYS